MGEFEIIKNYFAPLAKGCLAANELKDDVASITLPDAKQLIISKDLSVQDVHFKLEDGGYNIGNKLLCVNLSDLASAGAEPLYYMLGFSKNSQMTENFIADFCLGLKEAADCYNLALIGGDTVAAGDKLFFSLTIFGQTNKGQSLSRNKAKAGDLVWVSGFIGDAFLGRKIAYDKLGVSLVSEEKEYLLNRHYLPTPRLRLGQLLLEHGLANAAIDVSDGLLSDLNHICVNSTLKATIYLKQIPFSKAAQAVLNQNNVSPLELISGGDDYELIFTSPKQKQEEVLELSAKLALPINCVGSLESATLGQTPFLKLLDLEGKEIAITSLGYQHF